MAYQVPNQSTLSPPQPEAGQPASAPFRFFALPPEIRLMIYDSAVPEETVLPKKGPLLAPLDGLLRASKTARAEILEYKTRRVAWEGRLTSRAWRKFQKVLIPHIGSLTVMVLQGGRQEPFEPIFMPTWKDLDVGCVKEVGHIVSWMACRGKAGLREKYPWRLEKVVFVAIFTRGSDGQRFVAEGVNSGVKSWTTGLWSDNPAVVRLQGCGTVVQVRRQQFIKY